MVGLLRGLCRAIRASALPPKKRVAHCSRLRRELLTGRFLDVQEFG